MSCRCSFTIKYVFKIKRKDFSLFCVREPIITLSVVAWWRNNSGVWVVSRHDEWSSLSWRQWGSSKQWSPCKPFTRLKVRWSFHEIIFLRILRHVYIQVPVFPGLIFLYLHVPSFIFTQVTSNIFKVVSTGLSWQSFHAFLSFFTGLWYCAVLTAQIPSLQVGSKGLQSRKLTV
jgi:hypothetical protein